MNENMYYGASNFIFQRARELRNRMTPAEESLWRQLHVNEWKLKFRRQHPIANYVVDFYCHALKLVIELDGGIHDVEEVKRMDQEREENLKALGLNVIRFKNEEVFQNSKTVLETIAKTIGILQRNAIADQGGDKSKKLYVIKIGGNIIDNDIALQNFLKDFSKLFGGHTSPPSGDGGKKVILVHGGGKLATSMAEAMGVQQQMLEGRRITDAETLKIVTMVFAGYINKNIVAQLQSLGCNALGLSGADGDVIRAHKRKAAVDYGFVGDVDVVNAELLSRFLQQHDTVVLAPITHDGKGQLLNTNADTIAQETATAMSHYYATELIYSFEKSGVLLDVNDETSVLRQITPASYQQLKAEGKIFAGMIPKLDNTFVALQRGVKKVIIGKAEALQELIQGDSGTSIVHE